MTLDRVPFAFEHAGDEVREFGVRVSEQQTRDLRRGLRRQQQPKRRAAAGVPGLEAAAGLGEHLGRRREAESRALTGRFRGVEGLEQTRHDVGRQAGAVVLEDDLGGFAGRMVAPPRALGRGVTGDRKSDAHPAFATVEGVPGVGGEVQEHLNDAIFLDARPQHALTGLDDEFDAFRQQRPQEVRAADEHRAEVDEHGRSLFAPHEIQHAPDEAGGLRARAIDALGALSHAIGVGGLHRHAAARREHRGEQVVQVVREAADELPDRLHLLRLRELDLQTAALLFGVEAGPDVARHADDAAIVVDREADLLTDDAAVGPPTDRVAPPPRTGSGKLRKHLGLEPGHLGPVVKERPRLSEHLFERGVPEHGHVGVVHERESALGVRQGDAVVRTGDGLREPLELRPGGRTHLRDVEERQGDHIAPVDRIDAPGGTPRGDARAVQGLDARLAADDIGTAQGEAQLMDRGVFAEQALQRRSLAEQRLRGRIRQQQCPPGQREEQHRRRIVAQGLDEAGVVRRGRGERLGLDEHGRMAVGRRHAAAEADHRRRHAGRVERPALGDRLFRLEGLPVRSQTGLHGGAHGAQGTGRQGLGRLGAPQGRRRRRCGHDAVGVEIIDPDGAPERGEDVGGGRWRVWGPQTATV
jgi:hypothetical protein